MTRLSRSASASKRFHFLQRRCTRLVAVVLFLALGTCLCLAGQTNPRGKLRPWEAKDWTQWTWEDCIAVLNYSPWSHVGNDIEIAPLGSTFTLVQLRSALPVRQALLRNLQIQKHYDKMDPQKRREFDEENSQQLSEEANDHVVILIDHDSDDSGQRDSFEPDPPTQIALRIDGRTLVLPIQTRKVNYPPTKIEFNARYNQFEYVFPRTVDSKPLLSPSNLFLGIYLGAPLIVDKKTGNAEQRDFRESRGGFTFQTSDLMYKGKLEY